MFLRWAKWLLFSTVMPSAVMSSSVMLSALTLSAVILIPQGAVASESHHLTVAVANNFYRPMQALAQRYQQQTGVKVQLSTGSSGQLATQIEQGAPFDVFFSADQTRPKRLEQLGLVDSRVTYAQGKLVLWTRDASWTPSSDGHLSSMLHGRIALAEPSVAPYGKAAMECLNNQDLLETFNKQLVYGKGLNATFQFAETGNAQFAFLSLSQVKNQALGRYWLIPQSLYSPINQQAAVITHRPNHAEAKAFLLFVTSQAVQPLLESYGYGLNHDELAKS
ncbi:molybdate ABC transporter substrate-binding protein [Vibrio hippocampi]|uniref:Molybdate-binding protein ModA n=1 Tax=Vibrio hippocampi TaxID=654686 RepID=A0ABN8DQY8_9VIBR|nr:molybdate ABC transporter substrate-binding protein [Vibrio hippocampi]CAH0529321.1 Molybdate-binding protein ModA [Vibrio hippocampi]